MFAKTISTAPPRVAFLNGRSLTARESEAAAGAGFAGSLIRLALVLLVLGVLAGLAVTALLPAVLLGLVLFLPALLPMLVVVGGLLAPNGKEIEGTAVAPGVGPLS
jgi:hypothetical protein